MNLDLFELKLFLLSQIYWAFYNKYFHNFKDLFVDAYHLNRNPRFSLVDYNISADRSASPAPPQEGKTASSRNLRRKFDGIIEIDGTEHRISGTGNGALSALANALKTLGIDLDIRFCVDIDSSIDLILHIDIGTAGSWIKF